MPTDGVAGSPTPVTQELIARLGYVLLGLFIFRFGAHVPVPGVRPEKLAELFAHHQGGVLGLFNMFSGGALSKLTLFALGVMPYISASIIMQLLTMVIPTCEQWKKEGEKGRRKINQVTRYGTIVIASIQALGVSKWLIANDIVANPSWGFVALCMLTLTTGTLFLMWLGEQMTERGLGNGISLIIFAGIVSRLPAALHQLLLQTRQGQMHGLALVALAAFVVAVTMFVVFVERGVRKLPVTYARQAAQAAGQQSYLPLKLNMAGVIPPIFASSLILLPATLANWLSQSHGVAWLSHVSLWLTPGSMLYTVVFSALVVFFCFFYTAMIFNPQETADQIKRSGGLLPGVRPGQRTAERIDDVVTRLTCLGAVYLCLVALLPQFLIVTWHVPFYFGGTSLLIVVVVLMDFIAQIQALLMSRKYASLVKKHQKRDAHLGLLR